MAALYIAAALCAPALVLLSAAAVRSVIFKRSLTASLVEIYLRLANPRVSKAKLDKRIERKRQRGYIPYKLPHFAKKQGKIEEIEGVPTAVLGSGSNDTAILYLYGGGYFREPRRHHIKYLIKLSKRSGRKVLAPIYPKAPFATADEARSAMRSLYLRLSRDFDKIILMGDSSGGGLCLLLLCMLRDEGIRLPERAILFSPWVDLSMSAPDTKKYERRDPLIWTESALSTARSFAGAYPLVSPLVSPLFSELTGLCEMDIFVGDRELLYPQVCELHNKLLQSGVSHGFRVGCGMNHVYQIYPIPEARKELAIIADILK